MTMKVLVLLVVAAVMAFPVAFVASEPNTKVESLLCNAQAYTKDDPFVNSVAYVVADLMNVTPSQNNYNYYTASPYPKSVAYGHATCSKRLANSECANCLAYAEAIVTSTCNQRVGGQVGMVDCYMRFENYPFV